RRAVEAPIHERPAPGEAVGQELLAPAQDADAVAARLGEHLGAPRQAVDADEHQRRPLGHGAEGVHRDAVQPLGRRRRHYRYARGEPRQGVPKHRWLDASRWRRIVTQPANTPQALSPPCSLSAEARRGFRWWLPLPLGEGRGGGPPRSLSALSEQSQGARPSARAPSPRPRSATSSRTSPSRSRSQTIATAWSAAAAPITGAARARNFVARSASLIGFSSVPLAAPTNTSTGRPSVRCSTRRACASANAGSAVACTL